MATLITIGRAAQILGKSDTYVRSLIKRELLLPVDYIQGTAKDPIAALNAEHVTRFANAETKQPVAATA